MHSKCHKFSFLTVKSKVPNQPAAHLTHPIYLLIACSSLCFVCSHHPLFSLEEVWCSVAIAEHVKGPCTYRGAASGQLFVSGQTDVGLGGCNGWAGERTRAEAAPGSCMAEVWYEEPLQTSPVSTQHPGWPASGTLSSHSLHLWCGSSRAYQGNVA